MKELIATNSDDLINPGADSILQRLTRKLRQSSQENFLSIVVRPTAGTLLSWGK